MRDFWDGFEKRAFLTQAAKGVLTQGAAGIGKAFRSAAKSWGSGNAFVPTVKTLGVRLKDQLGTVRAGMAPEWKPIGQNIKNSVVGAFSRITGPKPPSPGTM